MPSALPAYDLIEEQQKLLDSLFDCDQRDFVAVSAILQSLSNLVQTHVNSKNNSYLILDSEGEVEGNEGDAVRIELLHKDSMSLKGLSLLQKHATPWLVKLLAKPPKGLGEEEESEFMDKVSTLMSAICGKTAHGQGITIFEFPNAGKISIRETSFTEAALGFQTWGAGILIGKMIDEGRIDVVGKDILELGSGTGLSGLVCGKVGARSTILSDYHPVVINNARENIRENNLISSNVSCLELDWRWWNESLQAVSSSNEEPVLRETEWKMILAADCVFDLSHSELVPKIAKHYLSKDPSARFYVLLPHRLQFKKEIDTFEQNMPKQGWILESDQIIQKHALTFRYYVYKL